MTLGEIFTHTYPEINIVAKRITRRRDVNQAPDLINTTFVELHKHSLYPTSPEDFVKWFSRSMKQQYVWRNSNFNLSNKIQSDQEIEDIEDTGIDLELLSESTNEATKDFIQVSSSMKKERVLRYIQVLEFKKSLPLHEQEVFELYYVNDIPIRKLLQLLNETGDCISYESVRQMVNSIKTKIKSTQWK